MPLFHKVKAVSAFVLAELAVICAVPARVAALAIPAYTDGVPVQKFVKVSNKVEAPTSDSNVDICVSIPLISPCIVVISPCIVVISSSIPPISSCIVVCFPCISSMGTYTPVAAEGGVTVAAYPILVLN